ncbi:MAG: DbpA RNA binding domain-containing protein [Spirochaetales bacterium]|nr:DbpA RNA binding domain-containing protein [Spirochaetales bacterium]
MLQKSAETDVEKPLLDFVKNAGYKDPTPLQKKALSYTLQGRDIVIEAGPGKGRTGLLIVSLLMQIERSAQAPQGLILTASADEVFKVMRQYRKFSARYHGRPHIVGLGIDDNVEREIYLLSRKPDIVAGTSERIIDHIRRQNITLDKVKHVTLIMPEDPPHQAGFDKDVLYVYTKLPDKYITQVYCSNLEGISPLSSVLKRPVQITEADWLQSNDSNGKEQKVENKTEREPNGQSQAVEYIKKVLSEIKQEENPGELNEFRRVFRRHTPFHLRAYVAAYLIREAAGVSAAPARGGGFKTLFVSVGKNRKVFPNDLTKLFTAQLGITDADLRDIKVLDNYSFIDIAEPYAKKAIDELNSTEFRGRKITVNYAREKRGKRP